MTTYTNLPQAQIQYKLDDARKNTRLKDNFTETPRARARSREITEAKNERGVGPKGWHVVKGVRHLLVVAYVVAGHEGREERVKAMVLELMVGLLGGGDEF